MQYVKPKTLFVFLAPLTFYLHCPFSFIGLFFKLQYKAAMIKYLLHVFGSFCVAWGCGLFVCWFALLNLQTPVMPKCPAIQDRIAWIGLPLKKNIETSQALHAKCISYILRSTCSLTQISYMKLYVNVCSTALLAAVQALNFYKFPCSGSSCDRSKCKPPPHQRHANHPNIVETGPGHRTSRATMQF